MVYDLPNTNIAEITLLGTGGGYGESCIIHYGDNNWAVVDSCINPANSECLPLSYLKNAGVDIANDVKIVLCTHWHDDHIRGLSLLYDECKTADLFFARANDKRKFLYWVSLDYQKAKEKDTTSSTKEFIKCLEIAKKRQNKIIPIAIDRLLKNIPKINVSIISLSPSDFILEQYDGEIARLITDYGTTNRKYINQSPNDKSVVLLLKFGEHSAVLGADLEVSTDNKKGWLNILDYSQATQNIKASLIKIPHHGSKNGFHHRIWDELVTKMPVAKLTPYNRGKGLPESEMIALYRNKTKKLYITSPFLATTKTPIKRDKNLSKILKQSNIKLTGAKYQFGLIRSRIDLTNPLDNWCVEVEGAGLQIDTEII